MINFRILTFLVVLITGLFAWSQERSTPENHQLLQEQGYQEWKWLESQCQNCEIQILLRDPIPQSAEVSQFVQALSAHKTDLMALYGVDGRECNLLAEMAIGILGRETHFFTSYRYHLKEAFPGLIRLLKILSASLHGRSTNVSPNSRGPTQIKIVPDKIAQNYRVDEDHLYLPENAALATMGFLVEALVELKNRAFAHHLEFVTPDTYVDYLPYIYFGGTRALMADHATPNRNIYVREMKANMAGVEIFEKDRDSNLMLP